MDVTFNDSLLITMAVFSLLSAMDRNLFNLMASLTILKTLDIALVQQIAFSVQNWCFYLVYSGYDVLVIAFLIFRKSIMQACGIPGFARQKQEWLLIFVYAISIVINLCTSAEYPIRWWVNKDILLFYGNYKDAKAVLSILEHIALGFLAIQCLLMTLKKMRDRFALTFLSR